LGLLLLELFFQRCNLIVAPEGIALFPSLTIIYSPTLFSLIPLLGCKSPSLIKSNSLELTPSPPPALSTLSTGVSGLVVQDASTVSKIPSLSSSISSAFAIPSPSVSTPTTLSL
jgi:hypothetical protein